MSFRNGVLLLIGVVLLSYTYHRWAQMRSQEIAAKDVVSLATASPSSAARMTQSTPAHLKLNSSRAFVPPASNPNAETQPVDPRYTKKPADMVVEFEVINGLAIAYGDTVLGQPMNGFSEKRGVTEIPYPKIWNGGVVPYAIQNNVANPERIQQAIEYFNQNTTVKFVPYDGQQPDAIVFEQGAEHCYSYLGRIGGIQPIFLSERCGTPQILHELMHALGFIHEQSRIDRDQYLEVLWDNIEAKYQPQFAMVPEALMIGYLGSPFDSHSIMMYDPHAFAVKKDAPTMRLKSGGEILPSQIALSPTDVQRLEKLYSH